MSGKLNEYFSYCLINGNFLICNYTSPNKHIDSMNKSIVTCNGGWNIFKGTILFEQSHSLRLNDVTQKRGACILLSGL